MSAVAKVTTAAATKEKAFEALCFDTESDSDEVKGLEDDDLDTILLISSADEPRSFEVTKKAVLLCKTVTKALKVDPSTTEIPLPKVAGDTLALVVKYLKQHNGKQPAEITIPMPSVAMERNVADPWDVEFTNTLTLKQIMDGILAANSLDCHCLFRLFCCKTATMVKDKSAKEIPRIFAEEMMDKIPPLRKELPSEVLRLEPDIEEKIDRMDDTTLMGDGDVYASDESEPSHYSDRMGATTLGTDEVKSESPPPSSSRPPPRRPEQRRRFEPRPEPRHSTSFGFSGRMHI